MKYIDVRYQVLERFKVHTAITGYHVKCDLYELSIDGGLVVEKYYAWDGPTWALKTKNFVKGSCVHDIFCEMINAGLLPATIQCVADEEMLRINRSQHMHPFRRLYTYLVVRLYQIYKRPGYKKPVHEVA